MPSQKKPTTIDEYISDKPKEVQDKLREFLACLREAAPGATEDIKWGVPTLSYQRILFTIAARKDHIGFYPTPSAIRVFEKDLSRFTTSSSAIKFPLDKPLPLPLIHKIAVFRVQEVTEKDARWM